MRCPWARIAGCSYQTRIRFAGFTVLGVYSTYDFKTLNIFNVILPEVRKILNIHISSQNVFESLFCQVVNQINATLVDYSVKKFGSS